MRSAEWLAGCRGEAPACLPVSCLEAARDLLIAGEPDASRRLPNLELGATPEPGLGGVLAQRVYARGERWGDAVRPSGTGGVSLQARLHLSLPSAGVVPLAWRDVDGGAGGTRTAVRILADGEAATLPAFPAVLMRLRLPMACGRHGTLTVARPLAVGAAMWAAGLEALASGPPVAWRACSIRAVLPAFQHVRASADARHQLGPGAHAEHLRGLLGRRIGPEAPLDLAVSLYVTAADGGGASAGEAAFLHTFNSPFAYFVEAGGACLAAGVVA